MKLMIFGHGRHGKDTVAELICKCTSLQYRSSSLFVAEMIYWDTRSVRPLLNPPPEFEDYKSVEECYDDRHNHRQFWHEWIIAYNVPPEQLSRDILTHHDMYVGIRNPDEYFAAKQRHLFDLGIWVDRSQRLPPEPTTSNKMKPEMADIIIDNNGTLEQLKQRVLRLTSTFMKLQDSEGIKVV